MADGNFVAGRWKRRGDLWAFVAKDAPAIAALTPGSEWNVLHFYWGRMAEIVLGSRRTWQCEQFKSSDALLFDERDSLLMKKADSAETDTGKLVEGGWNHEHCAICCQKIGSGGQPSGYVSDDENWVCESCYDTFVKRRSLDFIPKPQLT